VIIPTGNPAVALLGDLFQRSDQQGYDMLSAMCLRDGRIIDVEFQAFQPDLGQFIGNKPIGNDLPSIATRITTSPHERTR
jgi:hypothetical protein